MAPLRQVFTSRVTRNGKLYTLTVQTPFITGLKKLPYSETLDHQFRDVVTNHADQIDFDEVMRTAQAQVDEYLEAQESLISDNGRSF